MIRVLQLLTSTALGGGPRQVQQLVARLPRNEFSVIVAGPARGATGDDGAGSGVLFSAIPVDTLRNFPQTLQRTIKLIRTTRADLVHTHGKVAGLYGRLGARLAGVPTVHTFHGIHYEGYSPLARRAYLTLERALEPLAHTIINVSATQQAEALALGVARAGRAVVVVNGIDVGELAARRPWRPMGFERAQDAAVLGFVARFDPVKRHEVLVRAFRRIAPGRPHVSLLLIGDGPEKQRVSRLVADLGIPAGRVVMPGVVGWQTNPYPTMDLYVTAAAKEGLPLAPLEAMASRLTVIATDAPGHRDVVDVGATGLLVPLEDDAAMSAAIESLLDDPERRQQMGQAGRERVLREFAVEPMVEKTAAVYRVAAASRTTRIGRRS